MGDLSGNFSRYEFKCKCGKCDQDTVDSKLIEILQHLSDSMGNPPITVTSGNRCYIHNKNEGGWPNSRHLFSKAADIKVKGFAPSYVYNKLNELYPDSLGLGDARNFTHVDVRNKRTRWMY